MNTLVLTLIKIFIPLILIAGAFWPDYGAAWYIFENFSSMPALWVVVIAVWLALLALNLPLKQDQFRYITTGSFLAVSGAVLWVLSGNDLFDVTNIKSWSIAGIVIVSLILGWWTVSAPLLRWWRGIFPTDPNNEPIEG